MLVYLNDSLRLIHARFRSKTHSSAGHKTNQNDHVTLQQRERRGAVDDKGDPLARSLLLAVLPAWQPPPRDVNGLHSPRRTQERNSEGWLCFNRNTILGHSDSIVAHEPWPIAPHTKVASRTARIGEAGADL